MKNKASDKVFFAFFKRADIVLLAVFLLMGVGSLMVLRLQPCEGTTVIISVNGEEVGRYPLHTDRVIDVDTEFGHNTVTISGGTVSVTGSNCPNHDCESFGAIARPAQSIMCIPHRMIVRISGDTDIDTVLF